MDFPVEATVHLNYFQDEREVVKILRSHGFTVEDRGTDEVRVQGSFLKLRSVKARLEQLQNQNDVHSSSRLPVSSGAIPKNYYSSRSVSHSNRDTASPPSPNTSAPQVSGVSYNHPTSVQYRPTSSQHRGESFVVDGDVFKYADQLRRKVMDNILHSHEVRMRVNEADESFQISVEGHRAKAAAGELQRFLNDLSRSLRTQEVPLKDMDHKGVAVLQGIKEKGNIHDSVLVCEMKDRLHLIGPSDKSFELKQRLSGRAGRTFGRNSRKRSSSVPAVSRKNRDGGKLSAVGAAGYSPSKSKGDDWEDAEPGGAASRRRTHSESRENKQARSRSGNLQQETENKLQPLETTKYPQAITTKTS
ncbi:uncharacterized protein si:dkey-154b15.1 [Anabas testudineus]|uniref:uncharacterized protein si:dkey-154b15.1 n=1 Tax=Anabas testudineus TaxID=64144 RepID=UPI000E463714|nr:uncharacterized protein si:dkey-154b15.1 [Anabas testudineus]XP_026202789.1 uncharacterized protein si:dkey-154b15.1 [Anabas testudineus]